MLSHLDGDRAPALDLFAHARVLAGFFDTPARTDERGDGMTTRPARVRGAGPPGRGHGSRCGHGCVQLFGPGHRHHVARIRPTGAHADGAPGPGPGRLAHRGRLRWTSMTSWAWWRHSKGRPRSTTRTGCDSPMGASIMIWRSPTPGPCSKRPSGPGCSASSTSASPIPAPTSPWPYFRGKALVERALAESGLSYAVLRPAILFGGDGVLINNIAWLLRHLPVFAIGGRGDYRVRGIHVDDLAQLCLAKGAENQRQRDGRRRAGAPDL